MKFRFCGDGDCPDWVLAEIHSTLSKLSSVKLQHLTQMVAQSLLENKIEEEKMYEIFDINPNDKNLSKSAFSCLRFLLTSAVRHNTDSRTFGEELEQLGLPREHTSGVCIVMSEYSTEIRNYLSKNSLKVNELGAITYNIPKNVIDCAQLNIEINNEIIDGIPHKRIHNINIHKTDIQILLDELKSIKNIISEMDYDKKYSN